MGQPLKPLTLIVQSIPVLTVVMAGLAEEGGCDVLVAASPDEALRVLEGRSDIRLVFADTDVDQSTAGLALAHTIRERWPPIELILISSWPIKPRPEELPARSLHFGKPFDSHRIIDAVRAFTH